MQIPTQISTNSTAIRAILALYTEPKLLRKFIPISFSEPKRPINTNPVIVRTKTIRMAIKNWMYSVLL